ncbi:MAG: thioredoxin domain-containing protein, partial [Acidimicrobiaceae bacterium]|nr:thioredoxin domain-containing protein [Acidimicrobiaceae bacterium]
TEGGNWEGHSILWRPVRGDLLRPAEVEAARTALAARRATRVRPGLDDKVLAEWNAMAVAALAEAGAAFDRPDWVAAAADTADYLLDELRRPDGRWLRARGTTYPAYAADHAWLVEAFTRLAEATGQARWVEEARAAADALIALFWDQAAGGFATTGSDAEALIARPKDTYDGALPSANSTAAAALTRLGALTGEERYDGHAQAVVDAMRPAMARASVAFSGLVVTADLLAAGSVEVAITGDRPDLVAVTRRGWRPQQVLAWGEPYPSPLWEGREGPDSSGLAFVCRKFACDAPVADPAALEAGLSAACHSPSGPSDHPPHLGPDTQR